MNLRPALILANEAEYDLREVAFRSWRIRLPHKADEVLLEMEGCFVAHRNLGPQSPKPNLPGVT